MAWQYIGRCGHCGVAGYYNEDTEKTAWNHSQTCCLHEVEKPYERGDFLKEWRELARRYMTKKGQECRHEFSEFSVACISLFIDELLTNATHGGMVDDAYSRLMEALTDEANRKSTRLWDEVAA